MKKRIFSLFLAIVMVVLAVPTLAIVSLAAEAGEGNDVVYSTSFSSDPNSENFPTIDLPAATEESTYVWNGLDYDGVGTWGTDATTGNPKFNAGRKDGAITYKGNWELGTIGVNWDPAGAAAPTVDATSFYPYTDFYRASAGEICISTGNTIWGQNNATASGGLWLISGSARNSMVAGMVYTNSDPRTVTAYVGTAAVRYTAEYGGTVDLSVIVGAAYHNGIDLVILHNGTPVYTADNTKMDLNNGTDFGTVTTLEVNDGDTIDFVCLGDVNYDADSFVAGDAYPNEASFNYQHTKRGLREFTFTLDYTSIGFSYTSAFGENANYPTWDTETGLVSFPGAWSVGALSASASKVNDTDYGAVTLGTKFSPYTKLENTGCGAAYDGGSTWNSYEDGRGGGFGVNWTGSHAGYKNMMLMGVLFNKTPADGSQSTVNGTGIYATPSIRYAAEYTGTVTLSFDVSYPFANGTKLVILKNGEEVKSYAFGTKTGEVVDLAVTAGDIIDFVSVPDLNYDYDSYAAAGYSSFSYGSGKRGLVINELAVTYDTGYEMGDIVDVWDGENSASFYHKLGNGMGSYDNDDIFFFAWYDADGNRIRNSGTTKPMATVTSEYYAVPNPALIEAGVFSANDTYEAAMEKFCVYLKSLSRLFYNTNWQMGENRNGKFDAILYPSYLDQATPYMIRSASNNTQVYFFSYGSSRWVSEDAFDQMFDEFYAATWYSAYTANTTIPQADTKLSAIKIEYSADLLRAGAQGVDGNGVSKGMASAPTTAGAAVGGLETKCYNTAANIFWTRANISSNTGGSFAYTAPKAGTLTLTVNSVSFVSSNQSTTENLDTKWALFINGEQVTDFATATNADGANPADQINAGLAAYVAENGDIKVNKGDIVEIVTLRGASGGTHVKMGLTATLAPELGVAANLVIDDSYAMNLYVQPVDPNAAEVGVYVHNEDGSVTKMVGVKQTEGAYKDMFKVAVAEEIEVYELTHSTSDKTHADAAGVSVTYTPYEIGGMYLEGAERTSSTGTLLADYTASSNAKVANLAKAVQALAIASNAALNKGGVVDGSSGANNTKSFLKGGTPTDKYDKDGNPANGAEADINSSCPNNILLASWHYYTMLKTNPEYAKPTYAVNEGGGEVKIYTNADVAGIVNGMPYGYAEDVDPTDASKYAYAIASANVNMGDKLSMVFLVSANAGNSLYELKNGYRLKITGPDKDYYGDFYTYELKGKTYMGVIVDVPVKYYDTNLTITVVDKGDNAVSASLSYSVMTWCARVYNIQEAWGSNAYVVKAVYMLGKAAAAYAAK